MELFGPDLLPFDSYQHEMAIRDLMHRHSEWEWEEQLLEGGELFPGLSDVLGTELDDMDDLDGLLSEPQMPDRAELRGHDCMWAGLCVSDKHERDAVQRIRLPTPKPAPKVIAPTSARSVLLPPPPRLPDRPDTPLSESELELDLPYLCDLLGDQWMSSVVPSEVTGQTAPVLPPTPSVSPTLKPTPPPPQPRTVTSYSLISDHCYYSTLPPAHPVHTDNLGVQTPSDSEEEIDVETVCDRRPTRSVSSPCTTMPTAPTPQDRRDLQRTMQQHMLRRGRPARRNRRSSQSPEHQSPRSKHVKRKQYRTLKTKRKRRYVARSSSSDSEEVECVEKRSLHNNLERQRRIDLRNAFEELRVLVPETMDHEKAAKVIILNSGSIYCQNLEYTENRLQTEKAALRRQQERLRDRLAALRRSLARSR